MKKALSWFHDLFLKIKNIILAHKVLSILILVCVIIGVYFLFKNTTGTEARYITTTATKGTIISSVTGSGQVTATNQIDLKTKVSETITYIGVKPGDIVKKGARLFSLDARDAERNIRNARTDLESAQLELEKFKQPPETADVLATKTAILDAEKSVKDAEKSVKDAYRTLLNSSISAIPSNGLDTTTPPTISGTYTKNEEVTITLTLYQTGGGGYFSATSVPKDIVSGTGPMSTAIAQPIGDSGLYIKFPNTNNLATTWIIDLPNKSVTGYASNKVLYENALDTLDKVKRNTELTIAQQNQKLTDLYTPDPLELRTKELLVKQKQDALLDAQNNATDYYIRAPFDGTIASVAAKLGDTASGTLGTIMTKQKLAAITLNEVDVAKVKLGQKATLTFDALDGLTITGEVAEIDSVGTVTQGVVNYTVKISFDTDSDLVKPGMSVSAAIITGAKQDALLLSNSAVKNKNGINYVETFAHELPENTDGQGSISPTAPTQQTVEIGMTNDTNTEILSGIEEHAVVVSKTITSTTPKTTQNAPSLFGSGSMRSVGGTNTRAMGR